MKATLVHAQGAPCPTAVLDGRTLPETDAGLLTELARLRADLSVRGAGHVLKNAIIRPSRHPLFDLDYRFVQSLADSFESFDLRGSCGHSILAAVEAAARTGMVQPLAPGRRVRVNVLNNGDNVVCETEHTADGGTRFTAHFLCSPPRPLAEMLMTGEPVTTVRFEGRTVGVSLVSMGNPYVLVPAADLGVTGEAELFSAGARLFDTMAALRRTVCEAQGWDPSGAFPKIAVLLPGDSGSLAVRAISVPSWHPTVALTGAICLGAAARIEGTVAQSLAAAAGHRDGLLCLRTPGGPVRVAASSSVFPPGAGGSPSGAGEIAWISVAGKQVHYRGRLTLSPLSPGRRVPSRTDDELEETACLPLKV